MLSLWVRTSKTENFLNSLEPETDRRGFSIFLLAFFTSLEGQTTTNLTVYATSAFSNHSLVATVLVVQGVVNGKVQSVRL